MDTHLELLINSAKRHIQELETLKFHGDMLAIEMESTARAVAKSKGLNLIYSYEKTMDYSEAIIYNSNNETLFTDHDDRLTLLKELTEFIYKF